MDIITAFYELIGSIVCHQLPERTINVNGIPLPFCARDTGIYTGFLLSIIYFALRKKLDADRPPKTDKTLVLCVLMLPMLFDGITSYIGLRTTTNTLRLLTGAFFGMCLPALLITAANFKIDKINKKDVLDGYGDIFLLCAINTAACLVILKTEFVTWLLLASSTVLGFVLFVTGIVYIITTRLVRISQIRLNLLVAALSLFVLCVMYLFSAYVLQPLKNYYLF